MDITSNVIYVEFQLNNNTISGKPSEVKADEMHPVRFGFVVFKEFFGLLHVYYEFVEFVFYVNV